MSEEQMPPMGPDDEYEDPALDYDAEYDDVDEEIDPQEVEMVISASTSSSSASVARRSKTT